MGNLPALFRPGPNKRGICLITVSLAKKPLYFLAAGRQAELAPGIQYAVSQLQYVNKQWPCLITISYQTTVLCGCRQTGNVSNRHGICLITVSLAKKPLHFFAAYKQTQSATGLHEALSCLIALSQQIVELLDHWLDCQEATVLLGCRQTSSISSKHVQLYTAMSNCTPEAASGMILWYRMHLFLKSILDMTSLCLMEA